VEATVQALLATADEGTSVKFWPCDFSKDTHYFTLGKVCGLGGIPNEYLRHLARSPLVHLTHLFNRSFRLSHFLAPWKEAKIKTLPKPAKDPKFPQKLLPISLLSTAGKLFEKLILRRNQKHTEERNLLHTSQLGSRADHSTTLQCKRPADHITLNQCFLTAGPAARYRALGSIIPGRERFSWNF
jgi:hypothetical protein